MCVCGCEWAVDCGLCTVRTVDCGVRDSVCVDVIARPAWLLGWAGWQVGRMTTSKRDRMSYRARN